MARFHLLRVNGDLALVDRQFPRQQPLKVDFLSSKLITRVNRGGKKELLLRAVGAKPGLRVSDWTAGLGTDSFLLAAAGCSVQMYERSRVLYHLLAQGLQHAKHDELTQEVATRMTLHLGDARYGQTTKAPDVIYLDPMFPQRNKSALVNGPMQYLQRLLGPDHDADELIQRALESKVKRVVVKRSASAPEASATFSLAAKANRFDVYERPEEGCS